MAGESLAALLTVAVQRVADDRVGFGCWTNLVHFDRFAFELFLTVSAYFTLAFEIGYAFLIWRPSLRWVMLGMAIILMYMLMLMLFGSLVLPLAVLMSLPLAVVGALGGLALTHNPFTIFSMLGVAVLTGLVGKNAILLVDYTNHLREHCVDVKGGGEGSRHLLHQRQFAHMAALVGEHGPVLAEQQITLLE